MVMDTRLEVIVIFNPSFFGQGRISSAQREAQMLVRLSIIGAVAAILMIPTTLPAQGVGGAVDPGGAVNPGG
jgi:hypothetical protein